MKAMKKGSTESTESNISKNIETSHAEPQQFIRALKKEILKLQRQNANLKAKNFSLGAANVSLNRRLKSLEKEHSECSKAPYERLMNAFEKHNKTSKK